ncbi:metallophosphoesterase [Archangium violaceum]|uniref:metallophosphoesterase n=1 Tax=Archangium violaceum TaxID=83451 RepID=UPI00193C6984|nr:metallophosphoesterase [Archangium violaceum]QRK05906.1 metallophosphoesterase [Archangium violaceum]
MKRKLVRIGLGVLVVFVILAVYGVFIEPRYLLQVERRVAHVPALPASWEGQRIAVLADFQIGMALGNERAMREAVADVVRLRPAVVLLLGDFVFDAEADDVASKMERVEELLRPLTQAGLPTFAVLGNHDYGLNTPADELEPGVVEAVVAGLRSIGVTMLSNEAVRLGSGESVLYLVGVDSHWAQRDRPLVALKGVPPEAPRLVLMHNPDSFLEFPPDSAPFAVAGHTHGGQIRIPFLPHWSWRSLAVKGGSQTDGWIVVPGFGEPGNHLYVSRGIGMSTVPMRINCTPELTVFTLRRDAPGSSDATERPAAARRGQGGRR